jgi:hypothetical protein
MLNAARRTVTAKELTAAQLSRLSGFSLRAATYWKSGRRPGPAARKILERLGIAEEVGEHAAHRRGAAVKPEERATVALAPKRPKGGYTRRLRMNLKSPPRAQAEERAALARLEAME